MDKEILDFMEKFIYEHEDDSILTKKEELFLEEFICKIKLFLDKNKKIDHDNINDSILKLEKILSQSRRSRTILDKIISENKTYREMTDEEITLLAEGFVRPSRSDKYVLDLGVTLEEAKTMVKDMYDIFIDKELIKKSEKISDLSNEKLKDECFKIMNTAKTEDDFLKLRTYIYRYNIQSGKSLFLRDSSPKFKKFDDRLLRGEIGELYARCMEVDPVYPKTSISIRYNKYEEIIENINEDVLKKYTNEELVRDLLLNITEMGLGEFTRALYSFKYRYNIIKIHNELIKRGIIEKISQCQINIANFNERIKKGSSDSFKRKLLEEEELYKILLENGFFKEENKSLWFLNEKYETKSMNNN